MPTENNAGIQTRAITEAQCIENEANPEQVQDAPNPGRSHQGVRQPGTIALDWYVPDFYNTRVGNLIRERLPIETIEGRILFSRPPLSEFFKTSTFKFDLRTGGYTHSLPHRRT